MKKEQMNYLKNHKSTLIGMEQSKKSAVCIPLIETENGYDILFEVRSAKIESQPGDICFPGGMVESGESTLEAAIREMTEELLVAPSQIEMIGLMDVFAANRLYVYPYAVILKEYKNTYSTDEVEEVFRVPLQFFLETEPETYFTKLKVIPGEDFPYDRIHGGREYAWRNRQEEILFYQYGKYTIWGMTAKMIESFVGIYRDSI